MKQIYSDLQGYEMTTEVGDVNVFLKDSHGSYYSPNLILPNLLAVKKLKEYLEEVMARHPEYYQSSGE